MVTIKTDLRELEILQLQFTHDAISNDVSSGKNPTPTTVLLVCDRSRLEIQSIIKDVLICNSS